LGQKEDKQTLSCYLYRCRHKLASDHNQVSGQSTEPRSLIPISHTAAPLATQQGCTGGIHMFSRVNATLSPVPLSISQQMLHTCLAESIPERVRIASSPVPISISQLLMLHAKKQEEETLKAGRSRRGTGDKGRY
jgi:hypothetical protein